LAGARLISSARTKFAKTGPRRVAKVLPPADDVARDEVGRELDARELAAADAGDALQGQRLGQAGHALDQYVAAGEQGDQHPVEQAVLTDDDAPELVKDGLQALARGPAGRGDGRGCGRGAGGRLEHL
jgi:hypothetical protein